MMAKSRTAALQKVVLLAFLVTPSVSGCKYAKFSPSHTMCRTSTATCRVLEKSVGKDDINIVLNLHNSFRATIASGKERNQPQAADMKQLEWDEELASIAQRWAEECKASPDCTECREVDRFPVGQNIRRHRRTSSKTRGPDVAPDWEATIKNWSESMQEFKSPSLITSYSHSSKYETYSQVVWGNTSYVGCGFTGFQEGRWDVRLYVCNYGSGGNIIDHEVYKVGAPCSACPEGWSKCSTKYPGLCERSP